MSISLTDADRERLDAIVRDRNSPQKHVWRARIVLLTAAGLGTNAVMRETGKSKIIWRRWYYTQRRQRLHQTTLGLRYETTAEQLRYVIAKLREMLLGHPMVSPEKLHVRFDGFGAYSLDVAVFAYIRTPDWLEYLAIREDINFRIIDIVNDAGTGFAFPSQTTYVGRDAGLHAERGSNAESAVEDWRSKGQLPFPEFDPAVQSAREDTLDYPPQGSPNYTPRPDVSETQPDSKTALEPLTRMPSKRWRWLLKRWR